MSAVTHKAASRLRRSPAAKHRSDEVEAKPSRAAVWKASRENIQRFLADAKVPSREELAAYWTRVTDHALSYIGRRPLMLVRRMGGKAYFHEGPLPPTPAGARVFGSVTTAKADRDMSAFCRPSLPRLSAAPSEFPTLQRARHRAPFGNAPWPAGSSNNNGLELAGRGGFEPS